MESKKFRILLLRAILGGGVGGFTMAALSVLLRLDLFGSNWGQWLFGFFLFLGLPYGVIVGGIVGTIIWLIHRQTRVDLRPIIRGIIGTAVGITAAVVVNLMTDRTGYVPISWQAQFLDVVMSGLALGALPGVCVGRQIIRGPKYVHQGEKISVKNFD